MRRRVLLIGVTLALTVPLAGPSAAVAAEVADLLNPDGVGVYAEDGVRVVRQSNGLSLSVSMATPEPGTYTYAAGTVPSHPEVFTLWAFVFNYPDLCTPPGCDSDDLGPGAAAKGGVYNVGGHASGGGTLTISGRIGVGDPAGAPPPIFVGAPLESPSTAEIHVAIAPHGALDPAALPDEFSTPVGSPFCGCWWFAPIGG